MCIKDLIYVLQLLTWEKRQRESLRLVRSAKISFGLRETFLRRIDPWGKERKEGNDYSEIINRSSRILSVIGKDSKHSIK